MRALVADRRAAVAGRLERIEFEGRDYWTGPSTAARAVPEADGILLLPGFDEFILGYKDRTAAMEAAFADRICPGNCHPLPILRRGVTAGIAETAARYARFLGLELKL